MRSWVRCLDRHAAAARDAPGHNHLRFRIMMVHQLTDSERLAALMRHPAWSYDEDRQAFYRQLVLRDFTAAIGLIVRVALEAEKMDHHPEWSNVYDKIDIWLTTHDVNGVSERDVLLIETIERLLT